jgi:hypothetical protein
MNEAFSRVLLGVGNHHRSVGDGALKNMVRTGNPDQSPTFPFETANNIAAVGKHAISLLLQTNSSWALIQPQRNSVTVSQNAGFERGHKDLNRK